MKMKSLNVDLCDNGGYLVRTHKEEGSVVSVETHAIESLEKLIRMVSDYYGEKTA